MFIANDEPTDQSLDSTPAAVLQEPGVNESSQETHTASLARADSDNCTVEPLVESHVEKGKGKATSSDNHHPHYSEVTSSNGSPTKAAGGVEIGVTKLASEFQRACLDGVCGESTEEFL
jgi:hypothetical protein